MKIQKIRIALIAMGVLAACTCYGYSRSRDMGLWSTGLLAEAAEASGQPETGLPDAPGTAVPGVPGTTEPGELGTTEPGALGTAEPDTPGAGTAFLAENAPGASAGSLETQPSCYVHIVGEVKSPGVYELAEGSRVFQAVEAAGGLTGEAAEDYINLAETISDGMKLAVPSKQEIEEAKTKGEIADGAAGMAAAGGVTGGSGGSTASAGKSQVNLNTASKEELMTLRGIGQARAEDIIRYREEHGGFRAIEDIMKVSGIKEAAFQKIKDDITV